MHKSGIDLRKHRFRTHFLSVHGGRKALQSKNDRGKKSKFSPRKKLSTNQGKREKNEKKERKKGFSIRADKNRPNKCQVLYLRGIAALKRWEKGQTRICTEIIEKKRAREDRQKKSPILVLFVRKKKAGEKKGAGRRGIKRDRGGTRMPSMRGGIAA